MSVNDDDDSIVDDDVNVDVDFAGLLTMIQDDLPPVMKDKSKNAARNRREKENGQQLVENQMDKNILDVFPKKIFQR